MEMKLNDGILDAIKKNLPEATAGLLKEYFEEHDKLSSMFEEAEKVNTGLAESLEKAKEDIVRLNGLVQKERELDLKQQALETLGRDLEIRALKLTHSKELVSTQSNYLNSMHNRDKETFNKVFDTVFANAVLKKSVMESVVVGGGEHTESVYTNNGQNDNVVVKSMDMTMPVTTEVTEEQ